MSASFKNTTINDSGNLALPSGHPTNRPSNSIGISPQASGRITASFTSTGNTTFTVPANVTTIRALVVGGGGGGGGGEGNVNGDGGAGGGGGGVVHHAEFAVTPGDTLFVATGAGGTGGSTGANGTRGQESIIWPSSATNLITNGTFTSGTTGWTANTATITTVNGELQITPNSGVNGGAYQAITTVAGRKYIARVSVTQDASNFARLMAGTQPGFAVDSSVVGKNDLGIKSALGVGVHCIRFTAASTTTYINLEVGGGGGQVTRFDDVFVSAESEVLVGFGGGAGMGGDQTANFDASNGGSGGGSTRNGTFIPYVGGFGVPGQGYQGGGWWLDDQDANRSGAGGGGAGGPGNRGFQGLTIAGNGGSGGPGLYFDIAGSRVAYGAGGGGAPSANFASSTVYGGPAGEGGTGAGANATQSGGAYGTAVVGANGTSNRGDGGGGGYGSAGGNGGSGVVYISYSSDPASEGQIRHNAVTNTVEVNERNTGWSSVDPFQNMASGGDVESFNGYRIHHFTANGSFVPQFSGVVELMVVGGGGGGGSGSGTGGGGGGVVYFPEYYVEAGQTYSVIVGTGGAGAPIDTNAEGADGQLSQFGPIVAYGGGGGTGDPGAEGRSGGSGGGGGNSTGSLGGGGGIAGQGTQGRFVVFAPPYAVAGGGGAMGSGGSEHVGGMGFVSTIEGCYQTYGTGGGGSSYGGDTGAGGLSGGTGGGEGGSSYSSRGNDFYNGSGSPGSGGRARPYTGGGGGGGGEVSSRNRAGGNGATGKVVVRYKAPTTCSAFFWSGAWTCPPGVTNVEVLLVGGGGGGGGGCGSVYHGGGGGGAGGVIYQSSISVTPGNTYPIFVGRGGAGGASSSSANASRGSGGENTTAFGYTAAGGGSGGGAGSSGQSPFSGGSGGGGGGGLTDPGITFRNGITGQGNAGGLWSSKSGEGGDPFGGGGGGAGGAGEDNKFRGAGNGGAGALYSITGMVKYYAGGGGGGDAYYHIGTIGHAAETNGGAGPGRGGSDIGGDGGCTYGQSGKPGTGSGGGGGAGGTPAFAGGRGGDGCVIIRWV